ncbi:MAG: S41 family peptidase [Steroidobacteraceae bacterium]
MELTRFMRMIPPQIVTAGMATCLLASCGGGSDASGAGSGLNAGTPAPAWTPGNYPASTTFAGQCAAPRKGIDPTTGVAYVDKPGSAVWENFWQRSWTHEFYLWYREVVDRDPALYTTAAYFDTQKTTAITASGKPKDQFHFTYPTEVWVALSQAGVSSGYGAEWAVLSGTPPRVVQVAYTEPNSPAVSVNLTRGAKVLQVDGVSIDSNTSSGVDTLNAGLFPAGAGETHTFLIRELNGTQRSIAMTSASVTSQPVYMLFNSHLATAESLLVNAFTQLQQANVTDLVLDLRYNGGGYLAIASEVAYMIAGGSATSGRVFERTVFNDQYAPTLNPLTGGSNAPMPFFTTTVLNPGTALPTLNLSRVFVITGADTCSASESIINSLRGIGMTVIQIGDTTCGKPYGFYAQDNCGTTYFSIQFQGVNDAGFGNYADGFAPNNMNTGAGSSLPGCAVADDFTQALGSTTENRLEAALYYRDHNACSPSISLAQRPQVQQITGDTGEALTVPGQPWRENRILGLPGNP